MDLEQEVNRIAGEYRSEGYDVVTHPGAERLPAFATDLGVDILATRGDEKVLVQVRRDRGEVEADQRVQRLADVILANPPWRNDLVILQTDDPIKRAIREVGEPSPEKIAEMLDSIESLLKTYDSASHLPNLRNAIGNSALVMAWAALEAAMRHVCREIELYIPKYTPGDLLRTLYSNGVLSREQFEFLRETMRIRNEIVHGLNSQAIDIEIIQKIREVTRWLLHGPQEPASAAG